jgi:ABC-type cobalamin/Fe3+-siderophores transport system ATPase subunit
MNKISYIKIQNFKIFGDEITIQLHNPTVLIGANNSGKTSVIQALALWSWAIKIWYDKKKNTKSEAQRNIGVALNRLEIAQVPIKETRYFWNNAGIRQGSNKNIPLSVRVGLFYQGELVEVGMVFTYHSPDLIYCQPTPESFRGNSLELIKYATELSVNLLYPMSGISDKEFVFQEEAIRTQIGAGQTANVLRNICYHLYTKSKEDWDYLVNIMHKLFSVSLKEPFVRATGALELFYNYENKQKTVKDLDITLAGRGQQQMLLVLAYLLSNKNSVLMIDEPDAHLEILRQAQIFTVLKDVLYKYNCQIIIVTHSEVVLNDASSVVFLADGKAQVISDEKDYKFIRDALKNFGIEHYYKAKINPHILYVESHTDLRILREFAVKYNHPAKEILEKRVNYYYSQNETGVNNLDNELERTAGAYQSFKKHFQAIKKVVPELKAVAIFDSDGKNRQDEQGDDIGVFYWQRYEIENYFINPQTVFRFVSKELHERFGDLFYNNQVEKFRKIFEQHFLLPVFNNNRNALAEFNQLPEYMRQVQFENFAAAKKVSTLLENTFREFAAHQQAYMLLTKGDFYRLIDYTEEIPDEVYQKLSLIIKYLSDGG